MAVLSQASAAELWKLIEAQTGIVPRETGQRAILRWMKIRMPQSGFTSPERFIAHLGRLSRLGTEWRELFELVTIGETSFLRDVDQLNLAIELLRQRAVASNGRPLNVWSAGCSTGEEAYSLAILCEEAGLNARVVATDLSASALENAVQGRYDSWSLRNVDDELRKKYFCPPVVEGGRRTYRLQDTLRSKVQWERHNLLEEPYPTPPTPGVGWDMILCRNVFIYFRRKVVEQIAQRFARVLGRQGILLIGASESLFGMSVALEPVSAGRRVVYARASGDRPPMPSLLQSEAAPGASWPPDQTSSELDPTPNAAVQAQVEVAPETPGLAAVVEFAAVNKLEEARQALAEVQATLPASTYHLVMGHLALKEHRFAEALMHYDEVRRADALLPEVLFFEGLAHRKSGDLVAAERALTGTLFLAPPCWQASFLLAGVYQRLGKGREARREWMRTLRTLAETPKLFVFASEPLFLAWFTSTQEEVERACRLALGSGAEA